MNYLLKRYVSLSKISQSIRPSPYSDDNRRMPLQCGPAPDCGRPGGKRRPWKIKERNYVPSAETGRKSKKRRI
ncbi:hypothetical protein HMPREF1548_03901 [Clostridium sp. KLE 1755]|nr:hypothetical protein HMPREF1548_03901 [Clostridium sp. KLE 1755]